MTLRYLLDANVLSELTRPSPNRRLLGRVHRNEPALCTAAPVWHELHFGVHRLPEGTRRSALEEFVAGLARSGMRVLPYEAAAAEWHAKERARQAKAGKTPPFVDGQIAAIAAVNGLVLITANTDDFAQFETLEVKDWTS
ncbi:MAG: type II toxin-antitoxin system VapC family toxin [Deltaproteobacteria bacterium]|nr:type II toxin-antitoxin system VapC family toxin [Deltaproteobacteria bacterium]